MRLRDPGTAIPKEDVEHREIRSPGPHPLKSVKSRRERAGDDVACAFEVVFQGERSDAVVLDHPREAYSPVRLGHPVTSAPENESRRDDHRSAEKPAGKRSPQKV